MSVRDCLGAAVAAVMSAVRWVFRTLWQGIRAWGRFMWKGIKVSVMIGLVVGTLGAISNMSLGLGPRSRQ
jgi:hypothetical protein